jgi:DNA-binding NtrC family response regulator
LLVDPSGVSAPATWRTPPVRSLVTAGSGAAPSPAGTPSAGGSATTEPAVPPTRPPFTPAEALERQRILAALAACAGNQTHAAKKLGISRGTLVERLRRLAIPRPRARGGHT